MTIFENWQELPVRIKSGASQGLRLLVKFRWLWIGALAVGLGILMGQLLRSPNQAHLAISILTVLALLLIILNRPLNGVLVWLFFMPFLETWIVIPMGAGMPDPSFSRFTVAFLGIVLLAQGAVGGRRRESARIARIGWTEIAIVATTVGIMLAAPRSVDPNPLGVIQMAVAWYLTPLAVYFFAKNLVKNERDLNQVLMAIALLGFVTGAYAAYEHATGNVLFVAKGKMIRVSELYREALGIRQIRGIWGGTGDVGRALAMGIPVTFYLYLESKGSRARRMLLAAMLVVQFYGIVIAMARTPWYSLLIALFVMQFFYPKFRRTFLVIAFVAAIVIGLTWDQVVESDVAARVNDENSTYEGRQARWQAGLDMWWAKPIRGWGFGRYEQESGRFRRDGVRTDFQAVENDYLYLMVGSGLIGLAPFLLTLLVPLVNSLRLFFRMRPSGELGFLKIGTLAIYWAVSVVFMIGLYTAREASPGIKLIAYAVAGAVVGTHQHLLSRPGESRP